MISGSDGSFSSFNFFFNGLVGVCFCFLGCLIRSFGAALSDSHLG